VSRLRPYASTKEAEIPFAGWQVPPMPDDADGVGPMFDWLSNGDVRWTWPGTSDELRSTQALADVAQGSYAATA
jgi:hypothetical protein